MQTLIKQLQHDFPQFIFRAGERLLWSPKNNHIWYIEKQNTQPADVWGVLHELGHATLDHQDYATDINLVRKEAEAWAAAQHLAIKYGIVIDESHIQDSLDTYRDWLHKRSRCPACGAQGVQPDRASYTCLNCRSDWHVTAARFCRPYRRRQAIK